MPVATNAHVDWRSRIEFELDHPSAEVWPPMVAWDSWMHDKVAGSVIGPKDGVGEINRVGTLKDDEERQPLLLQARPRGAGEAARVPAGTAPRAARRGRPRASDLHAVRVAGGPDARVYETVGEMESSTLDQDEMTAQYAAAEAAGAPHWLELYAPGLERSLKEGN
jgi:hypothetical protein